MAFKDMSSELRGQVPKIDYLFCPTLINRAWKDLRKKNLWSFQLFESNWSSPPIVNGGKVSVTQGLNTVVLDATAAATFNTSISLYFPAIQRQLRVGIGTIYNIWAYDGVNTITLDRPYAEATNAAASYSIFKCYYASPYKDHRTFTSVRDMTNFIDLFLDKTRAQIDASDPQRTWYYFPTDVVYYQQDQNTASPTYQYPMYELWGAPQVNLTWQLYGIRWGTDLVNDTDELPPAVGEDVVIALAKYYAYEWAEANKDQQATLRGPDYKFLMGAAMEDYKRLYKEYRKNDKETVNNWFAVRRAGLYGKFFAYYNSIGGTAYPGVSFGG